MSEADALRLLPGYGRLEFGGDGKAKLKYRAIDPALTIPKCTCGKPDCEVRTMRPFREYVVALCKAILSCGYSGLFRGHEDEVEPWPGVTYALQMAASLDDVFVDPSAIDDSEAAFWCGSAWDSDEEDRELASKYVAALITFNFVWMAYEGAVELAANGEFRRDKIPVRGRKIMLAEAALTRKIPGLPFLYRAAKFGFDKRDTLKAELSDKLAEHKLADASAAAELGRIFRNYIVHGQDPSPLLDSRWACYRFYSISRLMLVLIQVLVLRSLSDGNAAMRLSVNSSGEDGERAEWLFLNIHRNEELWRGRDPVSVAK